MKIVSETEEQRLSRIRQFPPDWKPGYAVLPTTLNDGRVIWLEHYLWAQVAVSRYARSFIIVRKAPDSNWQPYWLDLDWRPLRRPAPPVSK